MVAIVAVEGHQETEDIVVTLAADLHQDATTIIIEEVIVITHHLKEDRHLVDMIHLTVVVIIQDLGHHQSCDTVALVLPHQTAVTIEFAL